MSAHPSVLIVHYGSQYTEVIARTLRELGLRSVVLSPQKTEDWLTLHTPCAVVLSGSDASVSDTHAPALPAGLLNAGIPILGICYGMQLLVHTLGGKVEKMQQHAEFGPAEMYLDKSALFESIGGGQTVWASHRDTVTKLPKGFNAIACSKQYKYAGIANEKRNIWGVQFHPEVVDTPCGKDLLANFLFGICGCRKDWKPSDVVSDIRAGLREKTSGKKAIIGFSGGVDSTVLSAVLLPVFGSDLLAVCIDGGHLRENEIKEIKEHAKAAQVRLKTVDAREAFLGTLRGITDAEEKRAAFRKLYKTLFEKEIENWDADYICQGTLITDLIESGKTGGALIKTHHNTELGFEAEELAPFSHLFKYEVRALAEELELPQSVSERQPFPGPGLLVRVFGGEVTNERLDILREADSVVRDIIHTCSETRCSQLVVGLDCSKTVGVKGDSREYGYNVVVRGVETTDFMTARGVQFPDDVRRTITSTVTQVSGVTRVFFDETSKPPATTEFE